jgi:GNAT superfamily N-acetyltransferase
MNITIREADSRDVPAMAALLGELFTIESDFKPNAEKQARALRLILSRPELGRLFVLGDRDRVVGMANALFTVSTAEGGPVVLLEDVIVVKDYRGRGLGERLVEHVLDWARREGCLRVTLLVDQANTRVFPFYERLGFARSAMVAYRQALAVSNPD